MNQHFHQGIKRGWHCNLQLLHVTQDVEVTFACEEAYYGGLGPFDRLVQLGMLLAHHVQSLQQATSGLWPLHVVE